MTELKLARFFGVPDKRKRLEDILRDPIFMEAVDIVCDKVNQPIFTGTTESAALFGAFSSGVRQAFRELEQLPKGFEEKTDPKPQPKPWASYTKEKSVFGESATPKAAPTNKS
jgi:hypothetical protein